MTIKVPDELIADDMQVMYRSTLCTFTDYTASGVPYQRDGYQRMDIHSTRQGMSDLYTATLAVDGGGACKWRLSNATFGVKYKDPKIFGDGVYFGGGGGVVVIFDTNDSGRGGADRKVEGDLMLRQDYYPWLHEGFIGGYKKRVYLAGEGSIYVKYQALQARRVYFEPVLHSAFVVSSKGPREKQEGNRTIFFYPDGSRSPELQFRPSFRKLQAIRLAAEAEK